MYFMDIKGIYCTFDDNLNLVKPKHFYNHRFDFYVYNSELARDSFAVQRMWLMNYLNIILKNKIQ